MLRKQKKKTKKKIMFSVLSLTSSNTVYLSLFICLFFSRALRTPTSFYTTSLDSLFSFRLVFLKQLISIFCALLFQLRWTSPCIYSCIYFYTYIYIQMYVYSGSVCFIFFRSLFMCVYAWIDLDFYFPWSWWFHSICVNVCLIKQS